MRNLFQTDLYIVFFYVALPSLGSDVQLAFSLASVAKSMACL